LGHYSYAIYLFHVFFTAGTREVLSFLAPGLPMPLIWCLSVMAGLIGPVCVQRLLLRHRVSALLGLGRPAPGTGSVCNRAVSAARTGRPCGALSGC
jgi:peptidoglycan/LPS O-acetylase OafA/YrhL